MLSEILLHLTSCYKLTAGFSVSLLANLRPYRINHIFLAELLFLLALQVIDMRLNVGMLQVLEDRITTMVLALELSEKANFKNQENAQKWNCYGCKERLLQNVKGFDNRNKRKRHFRNIKAISEAYGKEEKNNRRKKKTQHQNKNP